MRIDHMRMDHMRMEMIPVGGSVFKKIALFIFREDERQGLAHLIWNAFIFGRWSGASTTIYVRSEKEKLVLAVMKRLGIVADPSFGVIPIMRDFVQTAQEFLERSRAEVGVMQLIPMPSFVSEESDYPLVCGKAQLLERSRIPFLLLPKKFCLQWPPFLSIFVPISGERCWSPALTLGLKLGNLLELSVELMHIHDLAEEKGETSILESMGDQYHHEYEKLFEELLARASPFSSIRDWQCVRRWSHLKGKVAEMISIAMLESDRKLLLFDWKGQFSHGHARIIKQVLKKAKFPIILTKQQETGLSCLKIGKNSIKAA